MVLETLDRDAGCFEAAIDPNCQRGGGPWYWDESNATSPNFREHLEWARAIHEGTGRPLLWWQMPFGVPSDVPGVDVGKKRRDEVRFTVGDGDARIILDTGSGGILVRAK